MPPDASLPADLEAFTREHVGPLRSVETPSRRGTSARMWIVESADPAGSRTVLKLHRAARTAAQEAYALATWTIALPAGTAPSLLARHSRQPALLMTHVTGDPLGGTEDRTPPASTSLGRCGVPGDETESDTPDEALGSLLARLHALAARSDDPLPLDAALEIRFDRALRGAVGAGLVDRPDALRRAAVAALAPLVRSGSLRRVPCHRDLAPRNVLVGPGGHVALIDFEHARPDLWLVDVTQLAAERWRLRPTTEAAFWRGYGRHPSAAERDALAALRALHALATIAWGARHDDPERIRSGTAWLAFARSDLAARGYPAP